MPKLYLGTKQVTATPMTRGEYNTYREWQIPVNEVKTEPGYLIEYHDGGKPNDPRHAGYISWSPADVFERSYKPIGTFQERVRGEFGEIVGRASKLAAFIGGDTYRSLPVDERRRLDAQLLAMLDYANALQARISHFKD